VEIKCEELKLNINQAVPLGLMINEILSRLKNGDGKHTCKEIRLNLNIDDKNRVTAEFYIEQLNQVIKEKLINTEKYLPATLIRVLTQQLEATLDHSQKNGKDLFQIRFQKKHKKGAASNM